MTDLTARESHFAFGENWRSFARLVDDQRIAASDAGVSRLFAPGELEGKSVIDIGCGSGLPALSLLRAGAKHVTCVDIDPNSVATTNQVLSSHAARDAWSAEVGSVFDLVGTYDVVHSWGVLHHTGDMWRAIEKAASLVKPNGLLAIAIYRKTPLCAAWRVEKRLYSKAPRPMQQLALALYKAAVLTARVAGGKRAYDDRGMQLDHDLHDWLGGYPYESASPEEIGTFLEARGFRLERSFVKNAVLAGALGSGCDEYVFRRS